jgi:ATP-dependent Clp protease protease subunit
MRETLDSILVKHTGQDAETVRRDTDRDFFMDGEQALQYGIIDKILTKHSFEQAGPRPVRGDDSR